jgi:hypothetical protein
MLGPRPDLPSRILLDSGLGTGVVVDDTGLRGPARATAAKRQATEMLWMEGILLNVKS